MTRHMRKNDPERIAKFPNDRIAFMSSTTCANRDMKIFKAYRTNQISLAMACRFMAENNNLSWVSREQFLNEMSICGWGYNNIDETEYDYEY